MNKRKIDIKAEDIQIILLTIFILPFLFLFLYNNPAPEDFYYANEAKQLSLWRDLRIQYMHGTGRYFQNFLLYFTPAVNNFFSFYKVVCFALMPAFFYSLYLSVKLITGNSSTLKENFLVSLVIFFLYLYSMPEVSSGFYWYGGLTAYHCGIILIPFLIISINRSEQTVKLAQKIFYTASSCLLMICIIGANEILAILTSAFIFSMLIKRLFEEKKINWKYSLFVVTAGVFFYYLLKSPGNDFRLTQFPGNRNFNFAFFHSFVILAQNTYSWLLNSPLLICTLLLIPALQKTINNGKNTGRHTFLLIMNLLVWIAVLYTGIFFSLWSTTLVLNRTMNFIYLMFLVGWFYNAFEFYFFIQMKYNISYSRKQVRYLHSIFLIVIVIYLFKENNIKTAVYDLTGGTARKYNLQMKERFYQINLCSSDSCEVDSLLNIPHTIFYKDITSNPAMLSSEWYGKFFDKKSITLKKAGLINK